MKHLLALVVALSASAAAAHHTPTEAYSISCSIQKGLQKYENAIRFDLDKSGINVAVLNQPEGFVPWDGQNKKGSTAEYSDREIYVNNRYNGHSLTIDRYTGTLRFVKGFQVYNGSCKKVSKKKAF